MIDKLSEFIKKHDFNEFKPNVGVFGENSTGKSTFLNSIIGKIEFERGLSETTKDITILHIGNKPKISSIDCIYKKNEEYRDLLQYLSIIDIPGYGKYFSEEVLENILNELDIILLITNASSGIKKNDIEFLKKVKKINKKVIVVYNKIDEVNINDDTDEINIDKEKKKVFNEFKKNNLDDMLISVVAYSSLKSFLSKYKNKKDNYEYASNKMTLLILYTTILSSFERFIKNRIPNIPKLNSDEKILEYAKFIIRGEANELERNIKEEVSFLTSLNPFNSKDDEAKRYVSKAINNIESRISKYMIKDIVEYYKNIEKLLQNLKEYNIFITYKKRIKEPKINITLSLNLNDLAWDSFWGDSFAEDVSKKFRKEAEKSLINFIYKDIKKYKKDIEQIDKNMSNIINDYINQLNEEYKKICNIIINDIESRIIIPKEVE